MAEQQQQQTKQSNTKKETTNDVEKKIIAGEYKLKEKKGAKSDVWPRFSVVTDTNGNELEFASCNNCNKVLVYSSHKSGTSGLRRHT